MSLLCGLTGPAVLACRRGETAELPQSHSSFSCLDKVVHTPVVCNDRCRVVRSEENCAGFAVAVLWHGECFLRALYTGTRQWQLPSTTPRTRSHCWRRRWWRGRTAPDRARRQLRVAAGASGGGCRAAGVVRGASVPGRWCASLAHGHDLLLEPALGRRGGRGRRGGSANFPNPLPQDLDVPVIINDKFQQSVLQL